MSYLFSDLQNKLSSLLGDSNTGTDDQWPLATRKKELNRGELQFCKDSHLLMEYATGTIASAQLAMPSDWLETFILIINNQVVDYTREISIKDYQRYYQWTGTPPYYYYWRFSGTRYMKFFGSVNGQTYLFYYFKRPTTDLSADSDVSIVDEEYREGIAYYAAAELLEQIGKTQMADRYRALYLKYVRDAQTLSEKLFTTKDYPNPDVNLVGGPTQDVQGGGYTV